MLSTQLFNSFSVAPTEFNYSYALMQEDAFISAELTDNAVNLPFKAIIQTDECIKTFEREDSNLILRKEYLSRFYLSESWTGLKTALGRVAGLFAGFMRTSPLTSSCVGNLVLGAVGGLVTQNPLPLGVSGLNCVGGTTAEVLEENEKTDAIENLGVYLQSKFSELKKYVKEHKLTQKSLEEAINQARENESERRSELSQEDKENLEIMRKMGKEDPSFPLKLAYYIDPDKGKLILKKAIEELAIGLAEDDSKAIRLLLASHLPNIDAPTARALQALVLMMFANNKEIDKSTSQDLQAKAVKLSMDESVYQALLVLRQELADEETDKSTEHISHLTPKVM